MSEALESILAGVSIFELLRPDEIGRVASRFEARSLAPGETHDIDPNAPRLLLLVSGSADLTVRIGDAKSHARLDPGDRWGDVQLLTGRALSGELTARTSSTIATLDRAGFDALLTEFPAIALPLARELATELAHEERRRRQLLELHAEGLAGRGAARRRRRAPPRARRPRGARVCALSPRALFRRLVAREGAEPPFWMLTGFIVVAERGAARRRASSSSTTREAALRARAGRNDPNPMHVHHFNYGLILIGVSGLAALSPFGRRALRVLVVRRSASGAASSSTSSRSSGT